MFKDVGAGGYGSTEAEIPSTGFPIQKNNLNGLMIRLTSVAKAGRCRSLSPFWILLFLLLEPFSAHAVKFENGFGYVIRQGHIVIEAYQGIGGNLVIPSTIEGLPVYTIGRNAFSNVTGIYSVIIPEGVTLIEDEAFLQCYSLTNVVIASSVARIGFSAFLNCSVLSNVLLPEKLTEIKAGTFHNCYLQTLVIPKSVTLIEVGAFRECGALTNMFFEGGVPRLAGEAFIGAPKLVLYYLWGSPGWQAKIGGRSTALWKPSVQASSIHGLQRW